MLKKSLITALVVALGLIGFCTAHAYQIGGLQTNSGPALPATLDNFVNPAGKGDALIYGYFEARGDLNFLRVVNTSNTYGVGAKVRFREGRNSNELLDFYICLSANDQLSAWVFGGATDSNPAKLMWWDNDTPTFPDPQGLTNNDATDNFGATVDFKFANPFTSVTADDTKEGYFEIIGNVSWLDTPGPGKIVKTPAQCAAVVLNDTEYGALFPSKSKLQQFSPNPFPVLYDVPNSLIGDNFIFDVVDGGGLYAYNATAIADFHNVPYAGSLGVDSIPTLADGRDGLVGVNYILTKSIEYVLYDMELSGDTTIINTFPTKKLSIEQDPADGPNGPFNDAATYSATTGLIGDTTARCENVGVIVFDDAENTPNIPQCGFSPCQPVVTKYKKCDEVSLMVVGASRSANLNSALVQTPKISLESGFTLGWIGIDLRYYDPTATSLVARSTTFGGSTVIGMPVISYELQSFVDGFFTHMLPLQYELVIGAVTTRDTAGNVTAFTPIQSIP